MRNKPSPQWSGFLAFTILAVLLTLLSASCSSPSISKASLANSKTVSNSQDSLQDFNRRSLELQKKRLNRNEQFAALSTSELIDELKRDSARGLESFNSTAYSALLAQAKSPKDELKQAFDKQAFLLGLLVLRKMDRELYEQIPAKVRVHLLIESLRTSKSFNIWGLPHRHWEQAAQALIAEGHPARDALRPLFSDTRKAPLWGSREAHESETYGYRVKDYAWALSEAIAKPGVVLQIHRDARVRDSSIPAP